MTDRRRTAPTLVLLLLLPFILGAAGPGDGVQRQAGANRADTAALLAIDGWTTSELAVLVDGGNHAPALIGAHLAARLDVPVLVGGEVAPPESLEAIEALGVDTLLLVGEGVVAPPGVDGRRVGTAGDDPAALAVAALDRTPDADGPVVLASAADFPDALAAGNLAPARLLLTDPEQLSSATATAIDTMAPDEVLVMGGSAAITDPVVDAVADLGPAVRRIAGPTRVDTALAAAEAVDATVVLAAAERFPDAIAVTPWAARAGAAVLLTGHDELPSVVDAWLRERSGAGVVVAGGTAAVGNFVDLQAGAALAGAAPPGFVGAARELTDEERDAMTGVSWHKGCPVPLEELVVVEGWRWAMDGNVADDGQLIVNRAVADDVLGVLGQAFDARFRIERMRPVREFGADDDASMAANNSSAFNCRTVAGTSRWSEHAHGWAVDLNPVQNPYVRGTTVEPSEGTAYLDRADVRPGMVVEGGPVVAAFDALGWGWGGRWSSSSDYQHFSLTGR